MLRYDEEGLLRRLSRLDPWGRSLFAAACAERLLPVFAAYEKHDPGSGAFWRAALDDMWDALGQPEGLRDEAAIARLEAKCLGRIPDEDAAPDDSAVYAANAGAAVTYALRTLLDSDPQNGVWAATQIWEAIDFHLGSDDDLGNPLKQRELSRQETDLQDIERVRSGDAGIVTAIRLRASQDAASLFESA